MSENTSNAWKRYGNRFSKVSLTFRARNQIHVFKSKRRVLAESFIILFAKLLIPRSWMSTTTALRDRLLSGLSRNEPQVVVTVASGAVFFRVERAWGARRSEKRSGKYKQHCTRWRKCLNRSAKHIFHKSSCDNFAGVLKNAWTCRQVFRDGSQERRKGKRKLKNKKTRVNYLTASFKATNGNFSFY